MTDVVLQVLPGVGPALERELRRAGLGEPEPLSVEDLDQVSEIRIDAPRTAATMASLAGLRTAVSASLVIDAPTTRPTGLVATEALRQLDAALEATAWQRPRVAFTGLRLEAAGSDTPQMQRIAHEYAERAGVPVDDDGDLVVRVRRSPTGGWEALVRTTPRPLATRPWRTERYPGALNATIAAAVVDEVGVADDDVVADLMCGSGTLALERLARGPAARVIALDVEPTALEALATHQRAARLRGRVETVLADVTAAGRPDGVLGDAVGTVTHVLANPPWGELLGEHETNESLYTDLLDAVDRLGAPQVRVGILTHDIRRFERLVEADERWRLLDRPQYFAKGHRPRLFVLERTERA